MVEVVYQKGDGEKYKRRGDITKVTVASDVDEIAAHAFRGCSNLTEFNFGDSEVTKIGREAFNSTSIAKIKLPDTLKEIGVGAFAFSKIKEVEVNVEKIEISSFLSCKDLVKVVLGATTVKDKAFKGCLNISTFIWPDSVKEVGDNVFEGCDKLQELAGSKGQEKVIEYLKSLLTPLMKLCVNDGKLEDIKNILDKNSEAIKMDWSGRVLDIVRRVNAITSSESAKTNSKITTLEASNTKLQQDLDNLTACMNKMMEKFEIDLPKKPSDTPPEPSKDSVKGNKVDKEGEVKDSAASTSLPPPPPGSGDGDGAVVNPLLVENEGGDVEMSTTKSSK
ncbi:hypothetical protein TrVE_jg6476 [Triparma verrucosa]|uniref:Uncharacterized protein n=1 Tax=Triparma verrucosa TaxID=1606542 RepID=A0A9W7BBB0_9STRA|nr:hypothetical protein TrVE_jg6476 [Triparma verrucosa]